MSTAPSTPSIPGSIDTLTTVVALKTGEIRTARKPRVAFLDVVRGLAAFVVLLEHTTEVVHPAYLLWSFRWFNLGRLGVAAFFLVSGFVIPYSLERANSLRIFWISRLFRLYPIYWFSIAVVLVYHFAGNDVMMGAYLSNWPKVLAWNLTMLQAFIYLPHEHPHLLPNAIGLYWTLTLELVFYVLVSALFALGIHKRSLLWAWAGLGAMLASGIIQQVTHHKIPTSTVGLLSLALIGTVVFRYYNAQVSKRQLGVLSIAAMIVFAITFTLGFDSPRVTHGEQWSSLSMFTSYLGAGILFYFIYQFRESEFPRALRWLGLISYSVYLLHYPVWLALMKIPHSGLLAGSLWQLLVFCTVMVVASITYLLVEKPAVQLGKKLLGKSHSHGAAGVHVSINPEEPRPLATSR